MTAFQRFLSASALANLADGVATIAWVWVATYLTREAFLVALVPVALSLPWAIFAIPAGIVADRVDRRRLVVAMDAVRAAAFLAAGVVLMAAGALPPAPDQGVVSVPLFAALCFSALVVGIAEVFRDNAAQTLLPSIVPDAGLERANGRLWTVEAIANQMAGPAFGAFLLGAAMALPFVINAVCYIIAALLMSRLHGAFRPAPPQDRRWRVALAQGFAFMRGQPLLILLAVITGGWNLFSAAIFFALVLHAQENLGLDAQQYGFVLMGMAAGGIIAGLSGDRVIARFGSRQAMLWALFLGSLAMLAFPLMPNGPALAACFFALEVVGITWNIVSVSLRQRLIPDALRGRVNSIYRLLAWGMIPLGVALAGWSVALAEPALGRGIALTVPLWAAGIGQVVLCLLLLRPLSRRLARQPAGSLQE